MVLRSIVVWIVLVVIAIANGLFRESVIRPRLGELWARIASTLILCALILLLAIATITWIGPANERDALLVGVIWMLLTLAFEFLAGHYLFGDPWEKLLADYNIFRGRIWVLVPITTLLAPWLPVRVRGL